MRTGVRVRAFRSKDVEGAGSFVVRREVAASLWVLAAWLPLPGCRREHSHLTDQVSLPPPSSSKPSAAPPASAAAGTSEELSGPSDASADVAPEQVEESPIGAPRSNPSMIYAQALADSRAIAENIEARRTHAIVVQPGKASIEIYERKAEDGPRSVFHALSAGIDPWEFEGYEYSTAAGPLLPAGPKGPRLVRMHTTVCPGGYCAGGCYADRDFTLQWYRDQWVAVPELAFVEQENLADHDGDGKKEFATALRTVPAAACGAHWCCVALSRFSIKGLVGWDGERWSPTLARFRPYYERQRADNLRTLGRSGGPGASAAANCQRLEAAVGEFLWAKLFEDDEERARDAFVRATEGVSLMDCLSESPDDRSSWEPIIFTWQEFQKTVFEVSMPHLSNPADAGDHELDAGHP